MAVWPEGNECVDERGPSWCSKGRWRCTSAFPASARRSALASATTSYQVGKVEFLSVLDSQSALFTYETDYYRALSDFAKNLADLERIVGQDVLR